MLIKKEYKNLLKGLHSLRGIAALAIIAFHLAPVGEIALPDGLRFIPLYFGTGVLMFFVISGFSLFHSTVPYVGRENWLKTFYVKRFFRIAPLFYTMLLVYIGLFYIHADTKSVMGELLINLTFIYNFFPGKHESMVWAGWPISIEVIFYFIVPLFILFVTSWRGALFLVVLFAGLSSYSMIFFSDSALYPKSYAYMHVMTQSIAIVVGILLYHIFKNNNVNNALSGYVWLAVAALGFWMFYHGGRNYAFIRESKVFVLSLICGSLLLSQLYCPIALITNKLTVNLGELSYSIYLLHPLVISKLRPVYRIITDSLSILPAYIACYLLTVTTVLPLALITYNFIEIKGANLGRKLMG